MISLALAALVFLATVVATVLVVLSRDMSQAAKASMSPAPIFIGGMTIAGMLFLSHWVHWTW